jgi:hypothetical protein
MTALISAAKKHQTEARYSLKKIPVIRHEAATRRPKIHIFLTLEMKSGARVAMR